MKSATSASPTRDGLITLLHQASEAEHSLCCQYLYAAFSLRRTAADYPSDVDPRTVQLAMSAAQRWATTILFVARQEMEHLGIATNLLSAVGEGPYLEHGDFPDRALGDLLETPMVLERANEETMRRFQYIERPKNVLPGPTPMVETIYLAIKKAFMELPAAELFQGEGERQIDESDIELGVSMKILPVTNRASASAAIDLVLAQGEGVGDSPLTTDTHFARFTELLDDFASVQALGVDISMPVVANPVLDGGSKGATQVTNPFSRALMRLFDEGYRVMLIMLREFFSGFRGYSGMFEAVEALKTTEQIADHRRVTIMAENAYFPFMTMFVRPVGELIARQPAFERANPARAGASFRTGGEIPSWQDIQLYADALGQLAQQAMQLAGDAPDADTAGTLKYLYENLARMRSNILHVWEQG